MSAPLPGEARARRADLRFLLAHPAHLLALGFGGGLSPVAPGTVGTLWAWLAFVAIDFAFARVPWSLVIAAAVAAGWWACARTARDLGSADPGCIVWDEIVAFWIVLWMLMPASVWMQAVAFALFRFFDAAKPGPVGWADRLFKRAGTPIGWRAGLGVLFDDLVAALCTLLTIALATKAWEAF